MVRLLSIISLILALVLFPPAALAVVSNNAVPGDYTYPIKRGLEDIIYAVASLNPNTQALFAKARSDRRFQEIVVLTSQGKRVSNSLNELVEQTQIAASKIDNVTDITQKEKLISQLTESIAKYDAGLSQISQKTPQSELVPSSIPNVIPTVAAPVPTEVPQVSSTPAPSVAVSIATPVSTLPPTVAPVPVPSSVPVSGRGTDIDKTRDELGRIRDRLEKEKEKEQEKEKDKEKDKKGNEGKKRD